MRPAQITTFALIRLAHGRRDRDRTRPSQQPGESAPWHNGARIAQEGPKPDHDRRPLAPVTPLWAYKERRPTRAPEEAG